MDAKDLERRLKRIDGRGYKAYQDLKGRYQFENFLLIIDKVQADPFAPPSRVRIIIAKETAQLPPDTYLHRARRVGLENFLAMVLAEKAKEISRRRGSGKSGQIVLHGPGQEMFPRSAILVDGGQIEARFFVGLPAAGRRILAREAQKIFFEDLPLLAASLLLPNLDLRKLYSFVETNEDAEYLRSRLEELGLVAFVGDGSILPRASGVDPRPAKGAIPFESPPELAVTVELPNRGRVRGMGIPPGVTLIVGGGFHGKSTLLRALELGVYNHIPRDGRELVVSLYETVKIRAEDGRSVCAVDISGFINNLPFGQDTSRFVTPCASGSTSQAANIMEALEVGARLLLIDEDTSATNFMIRDARMQALIAKEKEPITPYLDRVRELYERFGVSSILVIGGSGDYLEVADTVIAMDHYRPQEVTKKAKEVVARFPSSRRKEVPGPLPWPAPRRFRQESFPKDKKGPKVKGRTHLLWGREVIDLVAVEQLVNIDQTQALAYGLKRLESFLSSGRDLADAVKIIEEELIEKGFSSLCREPRGDLAFFRRFELAAALNRLRSLKPKE